MELFISQTLHQQISNDCYTAKPLECCGILYGVEMEVGIEITSFKNMKNCSSRPDQHFRMDPHEWTEQWYVAQERALTAIGLYHSHPTTSPIPSPEDLSTFWYTLPIHWIVSCIDPDLPKTKAYTFWKNEDKKQLNNLNFREITIHFKPF